MVKSILISIIFFLCPIVCLENYSYAGSQMNPADLKDLTNKHIERVKISNPKKYREMTERAGGNITGCIDCHIEVVKIRN